MLNTWDSLMILWAFPRGLGHHSGPSLSSICVACFLDPSWLHFIVDGISGDSHMTQATPYPPIIPGSSVGTHPCHTLAKFRCSP